MSKVSARVLIAFISAFALVTALFFLRPQAEPVTSVQTRDAAHPLSTSLASALPVVADIGNRSAHKPLLRAPLHGQAAIRALGSNLGTAAALNGRSPSNLKHLLRTDSTMWLTRTGHVFVRDEWPRPKVAAGATARGTSTTIAATPVANVFALHSRPGSQRIIYLDFVGTTLGNDLWTDPAQQSTPVAQGNYAPWHLPANDPNASTSPNTWTATEQQDIQEIWTRVAEHYAPFDVDVTTDPASAALLARTSASDQVYGVRVLFEGGAFADNASYASGTAAWKALCPSSSSSQGGCGGLASLGTISNPVTSQEPAEYYGPAWIFADGLGPDYPKYMADAAAHEVGHSFDLTHQGTTTDPDCIGQPIGCSYSSGNNLWGPLMGAPYN
ncbi:MAG TPA: hypothetical protein VN108_02900, partial [Marmoricola sp.]|nr:hypothetical protein [Marmoricola sp.]